MVVGTDGRVTLTRKFVDGMNFYAEAWDGPVFVVTQVGSQVSDNLDNASYEPEALPFAIKPVSFSSRDQLGAALRGAAVLIGGVSHQVRGWSALCRELGVRSVYNTEYTLLTRLQVVAANTKNPLLRARRFFWEAAEEFGHYRPELAIADAVQCNGTPTFEAYRGLTPQALLYFDTRVGVTELASDADLERANLRRRGSKPLQLAFSGRLNAMKGADDLVRVADHLRKRGVDFQMSIFGGGTLEPSMRREIARLELDRQVKLEGVVDFHRELMPRIRDEIDLFVCCHRQGDPSCTYLETMAAGVPIAGYANEAFAGLTRLGPFGWSTPLGDVSSLADEIARLARDREALARGATSALRFAREHTFEGTFKRRIDHLREVASQGPRAIRAPWRNLVALGRRGRSPTSSPF